MNIIDLIEGDGGTLKRAATTNGGEFAGACPFCGGKDRFRVWPEHDGGRYWCRGCEKAGDSIQYLRDRRGLSFCGACKVLGHDPGPRSNGPRPAPAAWAPREAKAPLSLWQEKARGFLDRAIDSLWSRRGESMREWLHGVKGLSDATIKAVCLGMTPVDLFEPRGTWALDPILREDGQARPLWLPAGLVIPLIAGGVHRLRIRRSEPGDGPRYVIVSGSAAGPMAWGQDKEAAVIVESELDGLLLSQEAGDLAVVVAMGSAQGKPDVKTHEALTRAAVILVALDSDDAGAKAAAFWPAIYGGKAKRWPCVRGKDASEAWANGLDLRVWITAGLLAKLAADVSEKKLATQNSKGGV